MTLEEKQLLLKDLCTRLPYGVKCSFISSKGDIPSTIVKIDIENETVSHKPDGQSTVYFHWIESGNIKPYLRPMSSLVGKELDECRATCKYRQVGQSVLDCATPETIDYLNAHQFDYRGLIPMGLALEAPEDMYKTE